MISKYSFGSALTRPVFLILLVIILLMAPASAFANSDDAQTPDSTPTTQTPDSTPTTTEQTSLTDQSGGLDLPSSSGQSESSTGYEQEITGSSGGSETNSPQEAPSSTPSMSNEESAPAEVNTSNEAESSGADTEEGETDDPGDSDTNLPEASSSNADDSNNVDDTPLLGDSTSPPSTPDEESAATEVNTSGDNETGSEGGTGNPGDTDPNDGQELPSLETGEAPVDAPNDTMVGDTNPTITSYFQVQEVSMSPLLNPGSIVEVASATYADGDMVVAQKNDGTYIVKMVSGDQLVPLGTGTSYPVTDVTILGAAKLSSMTREGLEQNGLSWHTVLAQTATLPSGDGSSGNPYLIATLENLYWITADSVRWSEGLHYVQTANIDASATSTWVDGDNKGWSPIGTDITRFSGTYNGRDFTISNLYIDRTSAVWIQNSYLGLFGYTTSTAILQNINLVNVEIKTSGSSVGGLVGYNKGLIENCSASGTVSGEHSTGGLVGYNHEDHGVIKNSNTEVTVIIETVNSEVDPWNAGGLVGVNYGSIENSYSTGTVSGNQDVGGLIGANYGTIKNCYAGGNVEGDEYVGGLVGANYGTIKNCYAGGNVTGINDVGGLVGENNEDIDYCYATGIVNGKYYVGGLVGEYYDGDISNCYATGTVNGEDYVGGLIGYMDDDEVNSCYATGNVNGDYDVGGLIGYNNGCVYNSYAAGNVTGFTDDDYTYFGGLIGDNPGYVENSYWNSEVNGSLPGVGDGEDYDTTGKTTAEMQTLDFHINTLGWDITGQDGSYPVLGWQVNWTSNTWYMGTPPNPNNTGGVGDFGSFFDFDFTPMLSIQTGSGLTTITGQGNAPISPGIIAYGSWNDLNQAVAAYQASLLFLENNRTTLSPAELALLEVELAIARAAIMALEAKLLAADGLTYNLADLQAAYAAAVATVTANQSYLNAGQMAAANQLLTAIANVIAALQQMDA